MAATDEAMNDSDLPSYSQMIMVAIAALDEKGGSNKSAIMRHIESEYGDRLPENFSSSISSELTRMKDSGELNFSKNNYMKPGPDAVPKRGRGRPPKPKDPLPPGFIPPAPRPRGRPPKTKDPLTAAHEKAASGLPRPRGRPPKKAKTSADTASATSGGVGVGGGGGGGMPIKRGRGRPPKVRPEPVPEVGFA